MYVRRLKLKFGAKSMTAPRAASFGGSWKFPIGQFFKRQSYITSHFSRCTLVEQIYYKYITLGMEISNDLSSEISKTVSALATVFSPSDNSARENANRYLTELQRHPLAWQMADQLLSSSRSSHTHIKNENEAHVYFFAAQTIHVKCRADIAQLDAGQLPSLRESLMSHLLHFLSSDRNQAIVTRLTMALCSLAVQMNWTSIVDDLLGNIQQQADQMVYLVLDIFTLLPEEATSDRLLVQNEQNRQDYISILVQAAPQILKYIYYCIVRDDASTKLKEQVLRCLISWVRYISPPPRLLQDSPLVDWLFQILQITQEDRLKMNDVFDLAVDATVDVLRCYPSTSQECIGLVQKIIPLVMALGDPNLYSPFQRAVADEDEDSMRAYCRIFTEMGESYISLILHYEDMNQAALVDLILACSALPDNDIAAITLNFWYQFITGIEDIEPYQYRQVLIDNFVPQITRLVLICTSLLRYPDDIDSLPDDRADDIHRNRFYVTDTLEDCCRLLGEKTILQSIGSKLQQEIQTAHHGQNINNWYDIEACLKALTSSSRYIPFDENLYIPYAMRFIPTIPATITHLRVTSNLLVGAYSMWLNANPEFLQPVLPFLCQGLLSSKCAPSAALAIKKLCQNCNSQLALGDSVMELYAGILQAQQQQHNLLDLKDELEVFEGACRAISCQMDDLARSSRSNDVKLYINRVVEPIGSQLMAVARNSSIGPKQAVAVVERLTVVIRFLQIPDTGTSQMCSRSQFLVDLMTQCWSALDYLSSKFTDFTMAEKLCRLHKHCLRECGPSSYKVLLKQLCDQISRGFAVSRQSPYLYAASVCVAEFSQDPSCTQTVYEMIIEMVKTSFAHLANPEDFKNHPDVVEEFFFLGSRMIQHWPQIFVGSPLFKPFLHASTIGMKQDHKDANRGCLTFLENTLAYGLVLQTKDTSPKPDEAARGNFEHSMGLEGKAIAVNLILSLIGDLPCYRISAKSGSISGILINLNKLCPGLFLEWIKSPLSKVNRSQQALLLNAISNHSSRDDLIVAIQKFAEVCERSRKMGGVI